jgi:hypothetical protein
METNPEGLRPYAHDPISVADGPSGSIRSSGEHRAQPAWDCPGLELMHTQATATIDDIRSFSHAFLRPLVASRAVAASVREHVPAP